MRTLLADVWSDLRAKRLWPLAAALLVGLVAVPVVLSKPAKQPPPAPPPVAPSAAQSRALAAVELDQPAAGEGSSLDSFEAADPFRPPDPVVERSKREGADDLPAIGSEGIEVVGGIEGEPPAGIDPSPSRSPSPPVRTPETPQPPDDEPQTETRYQYVVDVSFAANGRERTITAMRRLDLLPSEEQPFLLFLGVESGGDNAVFMVDSTLQAAGEGDCRPSAQECGFVHIGPGSEHAFTNEAGDSYTLRVDEIRVVKATAKPAKASKRLRAAAARRFLPPDIADFVERH